MTPDGPALDQVRRQLDAALLKAHDDGDASTLTRLYAKAGDLIATIDEDAACFFWTHARVFALELGDPSAETLRARLAMLGRED